MTHPYRWPLDIATAAIEAEAAARVAHEQAAECTEQTVTNALYEAFMAGSVWGDTILTPHAHAGGLPRFAFEQWLARHEPSPSDPGLDRWALEAEEQARWAERVREQRRLNEERLAAFNNPAELARAQEPSPHPEQ